MVAVVGNSTIVQSNIILTGFISINYSLQPEIERLYQLGSFLTYDIEKIQRYTMNISSYAGASSAVSLSPSTSCEDTNIKMTVSVTPAVCDGGSVPSIENQVMFINNYSYSKDPRGWGQEQWGLQSKSVLEGYEGNIYILAGISTGDRLKAAADIVDNQGVVLQGSDGVSPNDGEGLELSVSAGELSIGEASVQEFGVITQCGGGTGRQDGKRGTSNASIPLQEIYL